MCCVNVIFVSACVWCLHGVCECMVRENVNRDVVMESCQSANNRHKLLLKVSEVPTWL